MAKINERNIMTSVTGNRNDMNCKDIRRLNILLDYASNPDILSPEDHLAVTTHLDSCATCQAEYRLMRLFDEESLNLEAESNTLMADIDWEENAENISRQIPFKTPVFSDSRRQRGLLFGFSFNLKMAAAALTAVFCLGIGLGYLLFHRPSPSITAMMSAGLDSPRDMPLARLENTLAKKEVRRYFQQSQLVLTDLMGQCGTEGAFSWKSNMDMKRVRALVGKSRYFNQELNNPDLLGSKELLNKIDWLLSEIVLNNDDTSCQKLQKFQDYIKQERLLFKIRLVGKELSINEV